MSWTPKDPIKRAAVLEALLLNENSPIRYGVLWNKCKSSIGSKITFDLLLKQGCDAGALKRIEHSRRHVEFQINPDTEKGRAILALHEKYERKFRYETQVDTNEIKNQAKFLQTLERAFTYFTGTMLMWVSWLALGSAIFHVRPEKSSEYERALVERGLAAIQRGFMEDLKVLFDANPGLFRKAMAPLWNLHAINEGHGIDLPRQVERFNNATTFDQLTWFGYPKAQAALMASRFEEAYKILKKNKEKGVGLLYEALTLGRFIIGADEVRPEARHIAKRLDEDLREALHHFRQRELAREDSESQASAKQAKSHT